MVDPTLYVIRSIFQKKKKITSPPVSLMYISVYALPLFF